MLIFLISLRIIADIAENSVIISMKVLIIILLHF